MLPPSFEKFSSGEIQGATAATQNPNVPCRMVKFKAEADNAGKVYVGGAGVTKADGTTDVTSGYPLAAGDETPWLPIANVNVTYRICDNAGDDLIYIALGLA